jgi:hypothetical protein
MEGMGCFCLGSFKCTPLLPKSLLFCLCSQLGSPYYVWLGCSRSVNVSAALQAFETDSGNSVGNYSPKSVASTTGLKRVSSVIRLGEDGSDSEVDVDTQLEQVVPPSSAFHYHSQTVCSLIFGWLILIQNSSPGAFPTIPMRHTTSSGRLSMRSHGRIRWKI